jgi:hypothetical protein
MWTNLNTALTAVWVTVLGRYAFVSSALVGRVALKMEVRRGRQYNCDLLRGRDVRLAEW